MASLLVNGLQVDPATPAGRGAWISGTGDGVSGALYRTDDAGDTWDPVHPELPLADA